MFRQMLKLFKGSDPLRGTLETFASMLEDVEWMYGRVLGIFEGELSAETVERELFARDRQVNAKEREIRRRLVEYLTITDAPDVSSCLILMSVSKDAERVGDYVKNMYDVFTATGEDAWKHDEFEAAAHALRLRGMPLFSATREAFMTSNRTKAEEALKATSALSKDAEAHVWTAAEHTDLSPKLAIAHALSARHLKRIARHLGNIATAVIQPVDWLNYADEPWPDDADEPPKERNADRP